MKSPFEVGEIAIVWKPGESFHREEVTISGPLRFDSVIQRRSGFITREWCHSVLRKKRGSGYCVPLRYLRKRPQPPDWKKLATPAHLPEKTPA